MEKEKRYGVFDIHFRELNLINVFNQQLWLI